MVTDHQPLKWLMEFDKLIRKLARCALMLQEYNFKVVNWTELVNLEIDGLSRNSCLSQKGFATTQWHVHKEEEVPRWHASHCLSLLVMNVDSYGRIFIDKKRGEESRGN